MFILLLSVYSCVLFACAGKIMWARQLFRKIKEPMDLFQEKAPQLLKTAEAKRIIRNYNKLAKVLLEFEVLYHREWMRQISGIRAGGVQSYNLDSNDNVLCDPLNELLML